MIKIKGLDKVAFESLLWKTREAVHLRMAWWNNSIKHHGMADSVKK